MSTVHRVNTTVTVGTVHSESTVTVYCAQSDTTVTVGTVHRVILLLLWYCAQSDTTVTVGTVHRVILLLL